MLIERGLSIMKFRHIGDSEKRIETALVLSGGGAKGAYQVGIIKELLRRGIKLDLVIGSSIGAFNGALLAEFISQGYQAEEIATKLEAVWLTLEDFLCLNWQGFLKNIFHPADFVSIYDNKKVKDIINRYIPTSRRFSYYKQCQLSVTATNLNNRAARIFDYNSRTDVTQAILASMTFPTAFPPVNIDNDYYIDGGILTNAPLKEAILWGARYIYIVFLQPLNIIENKKSESKNDKNYTVFEVIEEIIEMAAHNLMYGDLKKAEKINKLIKLLNKYEAVLPSKFANSLRKLYGIRYGQGKRYIKITKFAPDKKLNPPGLMGFHKNEVLELLIRKGEEDAEKLLH